MDMAEVKEWESIVWEEQAHRVNGGPGMRP